MERRDHSPGFHDAARTADDDVRRIVYYGPGLSGKTSNLAHLASQLPGGAERLRTLPVRPDDGPCELLSCGAEEFGLGAPHRLHLLTVPGRYLCGRSRRILLGGVDGVVFVADARRERLDADLLLLDELGAGLAAAGRVPPTLPLVLQYNRADARSAVSPRLLDEELNRHRGPRTVAVAPDGDGVLETLRLVVDGLPRRRD